MVRRPGPSALGQVAEVGAGAERRRGAGDHERADAVVGLDCVHRSDDLLDHRRGHRVALGGVVEGQGGDTRSTISSWTRLMGAESGHGRVRRADPGGSLAPHARPRLHRCDLRAAGGVRGRVPGATGLRGALPGRRPARRRLWETSYGLPGEGQPPRVVAHITFDWPTWSQTAYRRWYIEEDLDEHAGDRDGDRLPGPAPGRPPDPALFEAVMPEASPPIGNERLERAGSTVEIGYLNGAGAGRRLRHRGHLRGALRAGRGDARGRGQQAVGRALLGVGRLDLIHVGAPRRRPRPLPPPRRG